jgi:hypothetical protein
MHHTIYCVITFQVCTVLGAMVDWLLSFKIFEWNIKSQYIDCDDRIPQNIVIQCHLCVIREYDTIQLVHNLESVFNHVFRVSFCSVTVVYQYF